MNKKEDGGQEWYPLREGLPGSCSVTEQFPIGRQSNKNVSGLCQKAVGPEDAGVPVQTEASSASSEKPEERVKAPRILRGHTRLFPKVTELVRGRTWT